MNASGGIAIATLIAEPGSVARVVRLVRTWRAAADEAATAAILAVATCAIDAEAAARLAAEDIAVHTAAGDWRPVLAATLPASVAHVLLLASETVVVGDPRPHLATGRVHALRRAEPALSAARCRRVEQHFSLAAGTFAQYEPSVLAAPPALLGTFLRRWMELARSLAAAPAVLGDEAKWRELVAFSLAVVSCDERRLDLPVAMGLAAHLAPREPEHLLIDPVIVRGGETDASGALAYSPYPFAQLRLARLNRRLTVGAPPRAAAPARAGAPAQVVVLGMQGSGTSALVGALALAGLYAGNDEDFPVADAANPRGSWEHLEVWAIDETLVRMAGRHWHDVRTADLDRVSAVARRELAARARELVAALDAHGPWMVKDPRQCLLLPFWLPLLSHPVAVVVYREPLACARSVAARDGLTLAAALALWERYNAGALAVSATIPRVIVAQRDFAERPVATLQALVAALTNAGVSGLAVPDPEALYARIDPSLVRHQVGDGAPEPALSSAQAQLLAQLEHQRIEVPEA